MAKYEGYWTTIAGVDVGGVKEDGISLSPDEIATMLEERYDLAQALLAVARRDSRSYHEVSKRRDIMALAERIVHGKTLDEVMQNNE